MELYTTARTLMRDSISYPVAILVLNGLGAPLLAARIDNLFRKGRPSKYLTIYVGVLITVVAWGAFVVNPLQAVGSFRGWLIAIPIGIAGGVLSTRLDRLIVRWAARREYASVSTMKTARQSMKIKSPPRASLEIAATRGDSPFPLPNSFAASSVGLLTLIAVAVLEEILHRGWIVQSCMFLPTNLCRGSAILIALTIFGLLHLQFGWPHVFGKFLLGAISLLGMTLTGSVTAAIVTHTWFNIRVFLDQPTS